MAKRKNNLSPSVATIIASIITFLGIVVTGYFSIRSSERPIELAISATQTAVNSIITPAFTNIPKQTSLPNNIAIEFVSVNILHPNQDVVHPLFKGGYEFANSSTEPIVVEFLVIDTAAKSIDVHQVFNTPQKGFDVILYSPDYAYKNFPISPVNTDSSLNNRYYTKINIPPSGGRFLEGEYTLEIKPNPQYINSPFQFDKKSYLVKVNVKNTLDTQRIINEMLIAFVIFLIVGVALLNFYAHRYLSKKPSKCQ